MVLVKNFKFCERLVLCKIHPEKVFDDRKQAFVDNINMDLKRRQNWHFCKKFEVFSCFVFIKNRSRKSVC